MTRTKINGKWVYDPIKDYSNGKVAVKHSDDLIRRQNKTMAEALANIDKAETIEEAKKLLTHTRAIYPTE